ncbi:MAG: delta(1)-pyrroline-2-carboxylate reductase family protein [Solidesulfovibrio sp.]|uniref:delta(1)-pyrroline-2-carboxylate reductase family protein n=1 Tax=Solidesulfovibrio sp. TaxID=2910990 RepID=UPI002B213CBD|nr:delta(1)-pyrroline-2-carboxylate reductase family protein [Solidesulfovibrio sp.]MEA4856443.1 delta(1)-pyrroline-2-carboxylate reductase family protein [Solidesulfovibrio sp.]
MFDYFALSEAIAEVLRARRAGRAFAPERLAVPVPGGVLLAMPAADEAVAIVKNITVHPGNREHPVIQGEVLVVAAATGRKLAVLDAKELTARRTAAVSLLAARKLAARPQGPLCVIGAGVQARTHVEAFWQGLGVRDIRLVSRTRSRAEALAAALAGEGLAVRVVGEAGEGVADASLVVTVTTSGEPVFPDAVPADVFVAAVGSFTPQAAEVPATLVRRAALFVDDLASARVEAGDFLRAGVDWATVTPLEGILDAAPRLSGPVVFKTVGHALFDLAAAKLLCL